MNIRNQDIVDAILMHSQDEYEIRDTIKAIEKELSIARERVLKLEDELRQEKEIHYYVIDNKAFIVDGIAMYYFNDSVIPCDRTINRQASLWKNVNRRGYFGLELYTIPTIYTGSTKWLDSGIKTKEKALDIAHTWISKGTIPSKFNNIEIKMD